MTKANIWIAATGLFLLAAQSPVRGAMIYTNGTVTQNFDTLANSGIGIAWSNNTTLTGWHSFNSNHGNQISGRDPDNPGFSAWGPVTAYRAGTGSDAVPGLYSYGSAAATDRALGTTHANAGGTGAGDYVIALVLQNNNPFALTEFTLTYDGEQWRRAANATPHLFEFDYAMFAAAPGVAEMKGDFIAGYTPVAALNFTGPQVAAPAAAIDGNAAANRVAGITGTISSINWQPGSYLVLRWWDDNNAGNDHGLSLDNVSFSAVPEPGSSSFLLASLLILLTQRKARSVQNRRAR